MLNLYDTGIYLVNGTDICTDPKEVAAKTGAALSPAEAAKNTMATSAVPYMMNYGGYDQASLVKGGWLYAIISCVVSVGWMMTMYPVL